MYIRARELRDIIIRPVLAQIEVKHTEAPYLLLGTAAQESHLGFRLTHSENGSAQLGLYGITQETHVAVWDGYLARYPDLASRVRGLASQKCFLEKPHLELISNMAYATAIAWFVYARHEVTLPQTMDANSLGHHWLQYYREEGSAAYSRQLGLFMENYRRYIGIGTELAA